MSASIGKSKSRSSNSSDQRVWGEQSPYLTDIYGNAQDMYNNPNADTTAGYDAQRAYAGSGQLAGQIGGTQNAQNSQINPFSNEYSGQTRNLGMAGQQGIQTAMNTSGGTGAANVDTSGFGQGANTQIQGMDYNSLRAGGGTNAQRTDFSGFGANNPRLDAAVQGAMGVNNRNFSENIMSQITDGAVGAGQSGSSRQGIAEGIAARGANEANAGIANRMYADAYNQDMGRDLQARQAGAQQNQFQGNLDEQGRQFNQGNNLQVGQMQQGQNVTQASMNQSQGRFNQGQSMDAAGMQIGQNEYGSNMTEQQRQFNNQQSLKAAQLGAGMYGDNYSNNMNTQAGAIGQAGSVANLGMLPSNIYRDAGNQGWDSLANYQGAVGAPTTLGSSKGQSKASAYNMGLKS